MASEHAAVGRFSLLTGRRRQWALPSWIGTVPRSGRRPKESFLLPLLSPLALLYLSSSAPLPSLRSRLFPLRSRSLSLESRLFLPLLASLLFRLPPCLTFPSPFSSSLLPLPSLSSSPFVDPMRRGCGRQLPLDFGSENIARD